MRKHAFFLAGINLLIYCNFLTPVFGQSTAVPERNTLSLPVNIPLFLAGNFAEPRLNHFHSGIDIKTNGVTGIPVKSVSEGYVSRIKVEAGGYGNALYICHPNGLTSLYGHLESFSNEIRQYVLSEQYRRESFAVDLFPDPSRLVVKKGQIVAMSGNSGSSEGPHLHFELRETKSENPVNPLVRSIEVKDAIAPVIAKVMIYSLKDRRGWIKPHPVPMKKVGGIYKPSAETPISSDAISGIGIETYDLINGSDNHCGVYKITGLLDNVKFFESLLDEFSFAETRYVNSFMDYKSYLSDHKPVLKLFIDPNNQAAIYKFAKNRGLIELNDNQIHKVKIITEDASGNQAIAEMNIRLDSSKFQHDPGFMPVYSSYFNFKESNTYTAEGIEIEMPAGALYEDIYFDYSIGDPRPGSFSPLHQVHHPDVPVHLFYRLAIEATNLPENLRTRATIAQYLGNGSYSSLGGTWEGTRLITRTRNFGSFCIMVDTIKPEIRPLNFTSGAELKSLNTFKFTVKDNFSGIQSYRGEIDGKWMLLEYDQKNKLLEYQFDPKRIKTGIQHNMTVRVTDQLGNTNVYKVAFNR